jgi:acetylornithine deacetylase
MTPSEKRLSETVDKLAPEIVACASRLTAEPSTLGNEASVLKVVESELKNLGLVPRRVPIDPEALSDHPGFAPVPWSYDGRYNIAAERPADGNGGRSALFNGHLDVVSPEPLTQWDRNPFDPLEKDGWLWGRGAGDMKSGVAAMIYAVHAVDAAGLGLQAPVILETVIEEECTGNGALACRAAGLDAEAVLIPEPFGPTILTSQVGVVWFKVGLTGVSSHALETGAGINAIEKCYPLMTALRGLEEDLNHPKHPAFKDISHPVNLNIGVIRGGDWPSTVPAQAEFQCRLGFFPGVPFEEVHRRVVDCVSKAASTDAWLKENPPTVEFFGFRSEGHSVERDQPAFNLLSECHRTLSGRPADSYKATCTTDLRSFVHFGTGQATCFGPVAERIHGANERVNIESVIHTAKVYALFLSRWCGTVE